MFNNYYNRNYNRRRDNLYLLWNYGGLRFKEVFPTYQIFLEKTDLTEIPEDLYETVKNVYGNHYLNRMGEQDAIAFIQWNFANSYKMYKLILNVSNLPYNEIIANSNIFRGANFNPKNIDLNEFNETDNSFLQNFAKNITNFNEQPITILKKILENYTTAESEFLNLIKRSFAASRDFQPIEFEFGEGGCC